ncbi:MAG: cell division protein FtsQ/DivIB [Elusimicrobia bacterium]|nr:cell division protein FtsQ/DivIB [Elusimicrobiota bacterium]
MKHILAHHRHRVALRPKVRRRRLRLTAIAAALALLTGAAGLTVRHLWRGLPPLPKLLGRLDPRVESVTVSGAPAFLAGPMATYLNDPADSFGARLAGLPRRFPAVRTWQLRRDWSGRSARLEVTLRRAVAGMRRAGQPAGFLDESGVAFAAPAELYPEARLAVEAGGAGAEQLKGLPAILEALARDADLPAPAAQVAFRSAYEGWEVRLQDGTQVLWGDLRWTREKLSRLHEVLSDSRSGAAAPMLADLRYFEDGRVLLRPMLENRIPTR